MKEDFLHYIWQYQYFDKRQLQTDEGEALQVFHPGHPHINAGPDFGHSRLKLGNMAWVGQVEIHIKASDWYKHGHQGDPLYESVILHVVWENDCEVRRQDGSLIPCLSLKNRVSPQLALRYQTLQEQTSKTEQKLPCQPWLGQLSPILKYAALDRALLQRLERRATEWLTLLHQIQGDWEQAAYQQLAHYLGGVINAQPFVQIAQQVRWSTLQREYSQPDQLTARLFGYAGFLKDNPQDHYHEKLQKIFQWQQKGSDQSPIYPSWKWSRMRPSSFPTLRLAQLSATAHHHPHLLDVLQCHTAQQAEEWLQVPRPNYWQTNYHFGKPSKRARKSWPIQPLLVNWFVPLCYTYGKYKGLESYQERAVSILQQIPSEQNKLLRIYQASGFHLNNAADSQGALELQKYACKPRKCLSCPIGIKALSVPDG